MSKKDKSFFETLTLSVDNTDTESTITLGEIEGQPFRCKLFYCPSKGTPSPPLSIGASRRSAGAAS